MTSSTPVKRVGILTGGGDCPGLNAVIRAVTKAAISCHDLEIFGIEDGYLGLIEGAVWALDVADGSVRWTFPQDGEDVAAVFTNPLIVHDLAVVGDAEGVLYALDLATGEPRWTAQLNSSIRGGAASDGEAIYVVGEAGDARAFSQDGGEYWRRQLTFENWNSETLTARVFAAPTLVGDLVVIPYVRDTSYSTPALVALDRYIGSIRWEGSDADAVRDGWGNLRSSPAVAGGMLLFADPLFAGLIAVDATDGTAQWAVEGGTSCLEHWPSPAVAETTVVLPLHDGGLYTFDLVARQLTQSVYLGVAAHEGLFPPDFTVRPCAVEAPIFASPEIRKVIEERLPNLRIEKGAQG